MTLRASPAGELKGNAMWKVEGPANYYLVYQGEYTQHRQAANGRVVQASIMHPRFAGLRSRIDAAISTALVHRKIRMPEKGICAD